MTLEEAIKDNYFQGYTYSYPHKSAYREFEKPLSLKSVWRQENKENLFLYLHIPFCEMRCGFCNLFTMANPSSSIENRFVDQIEKQAIQTKEALGKSNFSRLAIGGGTPSFLGLKDLEKLFFIINNIMKADALKIPTSVETSPKTISEEKLALLKQFGTSRISIGVQSFILEETKALGRPQKTIEVKHSLQKIKDSEIAEMNLDLIYGMAGQTIKSWQYSLENAMSFEPTEIFLYPLYVRPLTGLGSKEKFWNDHRLNLYRFGRDFLIENDYEQITMRIFRRKDAKEMDAPPYNSPIDGMLGLGVGARSYTKNIHYSSEYAVGRKGVKNIIQAYNETTTEEFTNIKFGAFLSLEEQKRRFIIKSLLEGQNLDFASYNLYFGTNVLEEFPQLKEFYNMNLAEMNLSFLELNKKGLELSDVIGPWLYSNEMNRMMKIVEK